MAQNTVTVDTRQALIVLDKSGKEARQVKTRVTLSVTDGTLCDTKSAIGIIVAADGYQRLAANTGLVVHRPDTVTVGGEEMPNGYKDPTTGDIYCRAQVGGYSALGTPYVTDRTVICNADRTILKNLLSKAKGSPAAVKILPSSMPAPEGTFAKYPVNDAINLWVDTSRTEVINWLIDEQKEKENAPRKGQTMAERNAIKAHPAVVIPNAKALKHTETVECTCWYKPDGPLRLDGSIFKVDFTKQLMAAEGTNVTVDARTIEVEELAEEDEHGARDAEEQVEAEQEADSLRPESDQTGDSSIETGRTAVDSPSSEHTGELVKKIRAIARHKSVTFKKALKSLNLQDEDVEAADAETLEQLLKMLNV